MTWPRSAPRPHPWSVALLAVGAIVPLLVIGHWFREDDYLLFYHQGRIAPWRFWEFFGGSEVFFWRPLQAWIVSVLWHVAGLSPIPYNLALLAAWITGLWHLERLATETAGDRRAGAVVLAAALAFAGPTLMIAFWVSLLGAAWGAAAALYGIRLWRAHLAGADGAWAGWGAAALVAVAILMKESLAFAVGVLVVLPWVTGEGGGSGAAVRRARTWWPLALPLAVTAITFWMSLNVTGAGSDIARYYPRAPWTAAPGHAAAMLNALCWPLAPASTIWPTPWNRLSAAAAASMAWAPVLVVGLALAARNRLAILGAGWAILACFPAALLEEHVQNRYLHAPSIGWALAVGALALQGIGRIPGRWLRRGLAGALAIYVLVAVVSWGILLRAHERRADYGRALHESFRALALPRASTLILIDGLPAERSNRGLGLREFARLTFGRDDVSCALASSHADPRFRTDPGVTYRALIRLDYDGARFRQGS